MFIPPHRHDTTSPKKTHFKTRLKTPKLSLTKLQALLIHSVSFTNQLCISIDCVCVCVFFYKLISWQVQQSQALFSFRSRVWALYYICICLPAPMRTQLFQSQTVKLIITIVQQKINSKNNSNNNKQPSILLGLHAVAMWQFPQIIIVVAV